MLLGYTRYGMHRSIANSENREVSMPLVEMDCRGFIKNGLRHNKSKKAGIFSRRDVEVTSTLRSLHFNLSIY